MSSAEAPTLAVPRVVKPGSIALPMRISGARAFDTVARACLAHADANEPFIDVHGDHEGVHQFRVAYRRLRSLFSLCRQVAHADAEAARLKAGLRELTVAFGPARDLDVFLEAHTDLTPADAARLQLAREAAYQRAGDFLQAPAWLQLRADLDRWLAAGSPRAVLPTSTWSARPMAAQALRRRRRRILRAAGHLTELSPHDRHQVRIEAKKVRYGAQFFGSLWPQERHAVKNLESLLSRLQDELGALNDAATWAHVVQWAGLRDVEPPDVDIDGHLARAEELVAAVGQLPPFWGAGRATARPGRGSTWYAG